MKQLHSLGMWCSRRMHRLVWSANLNASVLNKREMKTRLSLSRLQPILKYFGRVPRSQKKFFFSLQMYQQMLQKKGSKPAIGYTDRGNSRIYSRINFSPYIKVEDQEQ